MFNLGFPELIVIFTVALLVFGPPEAARDRPISGQESQ